MSNIIMLLFLLLVPIYAHNTENAVPIGQGITLQLPPPEVFVQDIESTQRIVLSWQGKKYALEGQLKIAPQQLLLVLLDPLGRRMLTIHWDGKTIQEERADWLPSEVHSNTILAQIMLVHAPLPTLVQNVRGGTLTENNKLRILSTAGHALITVQYQKDPWSGTIHLRHHALNYEIALEIAN
jgi:hypothetical protein